MMLGQVIQKLSTGDKKQHINYRDSKLTRYTPWGLKFGVSSAGTEVSGKHVRVSRVERWVAKSAARLLDTVPGSYLGSNPQK